VGLGLGSAIVLGNVMVYWYMTQVVGGGWTNKNLVAGIGECWYRVEFIN